MSQNKVLNQKKGLFVKIVDFSMRIVYTVWKIISFETKRIKQIPIDQTKKILIIDYGFLGDTVISFPAVSSIRKAFPKAEISILINPKFKELWKYNPNYDKLIEYDVPWGRYGFRLWPKDIKNYFSIIKMLRKEKFDIAVDFRGDIRNIFLFLYMSNARNRIGFGITGGSYLLTKIVEFPNKNEVENNLAISKAIGGKDADYKFNIGKEEEIKVKSLIKKEGITKPIIIIFPTPGYKTKEWDNSKWALLSDKLNKDYTVILSGGKEDKNVKEITKIAKNKPLDFSGKLNFNELSALIKFAHLIIGSDTGPMHLASAVGAKTVALFGPTDINRWKPYKNASIVSKKVECSPCGLYEFCNQKEKQNCMKKITVDDVLEKTK